MDESLNFDKIFGGEEHSHEKFIQFYKYTIESWKLTPEYLDILNDIKSVINLDELKLKNKIKYIFFEIEKFTGHEEDASLKNEIEKNIEDIKKLSPDKLSIDDKNLDSLNLIGKILVLEYEAKFKSESENLLSKNIALTQFLINTKSELNFGKLINSPELYKIPIDLVYKIRDLGSDLGLLNILETLENNQLQKLIHSITSSQAHDPRYSEKRKTYEFAVDDADLLWGEESAFTINEMVVYLRTQKKYAGISKKSMRAKIHPIAEKYGKIPGRGRPRKNK